MATKRIPKYITHNIDEAAYLILHGLSYKVAPIDWYSATFTFSHTPKMERYRKEFYGVGGNVNIHQWLAVRAAVKTESRSICKIPKVKPKDKTIVGTVNSNGSFPYVGCKYFYVFEDQVINNIYGTKDIHKLRLKEGNVFKTEAEARTYLATLPKK